MIQHEGPLPSVIFNKYLCYSTTALISDRQVLSFSLVSIFYFCFVKLHNHIDIVTDYLSVACDDTSSYQLKIKERRDQFIQNTANITCNMIKSWIHVQVLIFSRLFEVLLQILITCLAYAGRKCFWQKTKTIFIYYQLICKQIKISNVILKPILLWVFFFKR